MNVYDFDRTLFPGDSSMHFWAYCKNKYPLIWLHFPAGITKMGLYKLGFFHWAQVMEKFFSFMKYIPDNEKEKIIEEFWDEKVSKIYPWYKQLHKEDDILISATPHFIIDPIARRLGIKHVIATNMDISTYRITGLDCTGIEKVKRLKATYGDVEVDNFYSDSYSDMPLAQIAKNAYMIGKHGEINEWDFKNKRGIKKNYRLVKRYTKLKDVRAKIGAKRTKRKLRHERKLHKHKK